MPWKYEKHVEGPLKRNYVQAYIGSEAGKQAIERFVKDVSNNSEFTLLVQSPKYRFAYPKGLAQRDVWVCYWDPDIFNDETWGELSP